MTKVLEDYTKEELIATIKDLKRRKKFGLVWEDKPEEVVRLCETELPVLEEVAKRAITKRPEGPTNLIVEGDNYHSLSALNYTHTDKIDVIYIDPPYNTGNKDFLYNDHYIDRDDTYRHSKWLSFMEKRLRLAKSLLNQGGAIFISIDDNEMANLKMLCDEIFGARNFIASMPKKGSGGRQDSKHFAVVHEYVVCYAKNIDNYSAGRAAKDESTFTKYDEHKQRYYKTQLLRKWGDNSRRSDRPNLFYPLYVTPSGELNLDRKTDDDIEVLPMLNKQQEGCWRWGKKTMQLNIDDGIVEIQNKQGEITLYERVYKPDAPQTKPYSTWIDEVSSSSGSTLLQKVVGSKAFSYPKPLDLITQILKMSHSSKDVQVLDFMAGSGTTGHAVMELNKEDGGNRKFILCTNNENKIAEEITYPRIKNVIEGYERVEGIPANVRYFKTGLVSKRQTDDQTRIELVARSTDMICVREDTFDKVLDTKYYKVFGNSDHYSAIVFEPDVIPLLKDALAKLDNDKPIHIYVFSLSNDTYESDFADLQRLHELRPIPESILEVYRRIFKDQNVSIGA